MSRAVNIALLPLLLALVLLPACGGDIHLGKGDIDTFTAIRADGRILDVFCRITSPWVDVQVVNSQESRTLADVRDTLLPKLLSGEIRLKQAEKALENLP